MAKKKKLSYMAIAFLSYIYMQLAPLKPYLEALRKIKVLQIMKEALQLLKAPY